MVTSDNKTTDDLHDSSDDDHVAIVGFEEKTCSYDAGKTRYDQKARLNNNHSSAQARTLPIFAMIRRPT
jgi:hypothetical protein